MATELAINTDRVQKFVNDLENQKTILSTCTQLFTTLSNHFTSVQDSASQRSQSLESKLQTLESNSRKTLESLDQRENSIPERESAAAAGIEEQKEAALAEFEKPERSPELSECLKSFSRTMDSSGLLKFIISKRKESVSMRAEISRAIAESVDPPRLVLDALEEFLAQKIGKVGVTDKRWACAMLVQALFPEVNVNKKAPEFSKSVVERAGGILDKWKEQMDSEPNIEAIGPAEAVMFLQMVVGFGLKSKFDEEFLRKLVLEFSSRRDLAKLATGLEFGEKMGDMIDELVKNGKEIEAVYFASESGLTERFPPISLLKSYMRNSKKHANNLLKNSSYSAAANESSSAAELNSIKAIIKCVEDHKLESDFSLDSLKKRASQLERTKAERKKGSASASKPQSKRGSHGVGSGRGGGPPVFRPVKAPKYSNPYPSLSRRTTGPPPQQNAALRYSGPYNYQSQNVYEAPVATHYTSTYNVPHAQSPAAVPQQHYPLPVENTGAVGYRTSGSYAAQASYAAYDYSSAAPPSYQSSSYAQ